MKQYIIDINDIMWINIVIVVIVVEKTMCVKCSDWIFTDVMKTYIDVKKIHRI